jgi:hypothetical protein
MGTPIGCKARFALDSVELYQIDREQDHVKKKYRIEMCGQSIKYEEYIAQESEGSKRQHRSHAEAGENAECRCKADDVDPRHASLSLMFNVDSQWLRSRRRTARVACFGLSPRLANPPSM